MRTGLAQRSYAPTNEVGPGKPDTGTNGEKTYSGGKDNWRQACMEKRHRELWNHASDCWEDRCTANISEIGGYLWKQQSLLVCSLGKDLLKRIFVPYCSNSNLAYMYKNCTLCILLCTKYSVPLIYKYLMCLQAKGSAIKLVKPQSNSSVDLNPSQN